MVRLKIALNKKMVSAKEALISEASKFVSHKKKYETLSF
jgi:hypothetical protein